MARGQQPTALLDMEERSLDADRLLVDNVECILRFSLKSLSIMDQRAVVVLPQFGFPPLAVCRAARPAG
jgi:hypothetical protein